MISSTTPQPHPTCVKPSEDAGYYGIHFFVLQEYLLFLLVIQESMWAQLMHRGSPVLWRTPFKHSLPLNQNIFGILQNFIGKTQRRHEQPV